MRWVVIWWRGQEGTHITFPHIPGSTTRAKCRQITPILAMLTPPPKGSDRWVVSSRLAWVTE